MKKYKWLTRASLLALSALMLLFVPVAALAAVDVVEPTKEFYVADYANVLSSGTEAHIIELNAKLYKKTGAQIVVVTVDFLGGMEIEDYAMKLFKKWGIGDKTKNNGLLLLLAIGEDNYWAVQGRGLERSISSGTLGDILYDNLEADFAKGRYDNGVRKTFDVLHNKVEMVYSGGKTALAKADRPPANSEKTNTKWLIFIDIMVIMASIVVMAYNLSGGRRKRGETRVVVIQSGVGNDTSCPISTSYRSIGTDSNDNRSSSDEESSHSSRSSGSDYSSGRDNSISVSSTSGSGSSLSSNTSGGYSGSHSGGGGDTRGGGGAGRR